MFLQQLPMQRQWKALIQERVVLYCAMSTQSPHLTRCLDLKGKKKRKEGGGGRHTPKNLEALMEWAVQPSQLFKWFLINTSAKSIGSCAVMGRRLLRVGLPGISWTPLPFLMHVNDQHLQRPPGSWQCLPAGSISGFWGLHKGRQPLSLPFSKWGNWGTERCSDSHKRTLVKKLVTLVV